MSFVILNSLCALGLAVLVTLGLYSTAQLANVHSRLDRVGIFLIALLTLSSGLTFSFWGYSNLTAFTLLAILGLGANHVIRTSKITIKSLPFAGKIAIVLLAIDLIGSSLPLYRYDQWTYHLTVAKWIDLMGEMLPKVNHDHIFFAGSYEYLGLLGRVLSNDAFQQGFQNALTPFIIFTCIFIATSGDTTTRILLGLVALFLTGDHEAIVNAKPDYILMIGAFLLAGSTTKKETLHPWIAGSLLSGFIAYKLTWIHFGVACAPVMLWRIYKDHRFKGIYLLGGGTVFGLLLASPALFKNYQVFGNPFHPAENPLFPSTFWTTEFKLYWDSVSGKPHGLEFFTNLPKIIVTIVRSSTALLLTILVVRFLTKNRPQLKYVTICLLIYILVWGVFYGPTIFPRFVSPLFGLGLVYLWAHLPTTHVQKSIQWVLLLTSLSFAQPEVTLMLIEKSFTKNLASFHDAFPKSPTAKNKTLRLIEDHRRKALPGAKFTEGILLSNYTLNFYGPTLTIDCGGPTTDFQLRSRGIDPANGCAQDLFKSFDIRYVWIEDAADFAACPQAVTAMIKSAKGLEPIPGAQGELYFVKDFETLSCVPD